MLAQLWVVPNPIATTLDLKSSTMPPSAQCGTGHEMVGAYVGSMSLPKVP